MPVQRKFKVTTSVTQHMWAFSRKDAEKYQEELIRRGKIDILKDGKTEVKFSLGGGDKIVEAPEDISKSRDPSLEPRQGDWLEINHGDVQLCALVRRLSRRKVYYYEALSKTDRSVDRERWELWGKQHTIHPAYDGTLPPFIVEEVINAHEERGMLRGFNATPDSSLILEILDQYNYVPDDYEVENGYWAEVYLDRVVSEKILETQAAPTGRTGTNDGVDEFGDFSVGFSEELPTFDSFDS